MDLPSPPLQPQQAPVPTTAGSSMPARRAHMEDGICPVNKRRRLALSPCAEVYNSKRIRSQWVDFQSLPEDILSRIMSKLTLKQAVQMSMVSSVFRRAWIFHPDLLFGTEELFGTSDRQERVLSTNGFIDTINFILRKHSGLGMPGFTQPPLKFINLRHLTMRITFGSAKRFGKNAVLQLAYLLEAAPLLVDLHLDMTCADICEDPPARDVIIHRPYYNLKRACMTGFNGNGGQIALVRFILRNAVKLEKMTIVPKRRRTGKMMGEYELSLRMIRKKIVPKDKNGVLGIL
uniref:F-box domain-containing protein n=1 Tax=Oryza meridionalis TaxID=40149 RepID=A0A0E0C3H3_9ORYZ